MLGNLAVARYYADEAAACPYATLVGALRAAATAAGAAAEGGGEGGEGGEALVERPPPPAVLYNLAAASAKVPPLTRLPRAIQR